MPKKKVVEAQDGMKNVAVAVGSALGKLAARMGLSETAAPAAVKRAIKKRAPKKQIVAKKTASKRTSAKKAAPRAKRTSK